MTAKANEAVVLFTRLSSHFLKPQSRPRGLLRRSRQHNLVAPLRASRSPGEVHAMKEVLTRRFWLKSQLQPQLD